MDRATLCLIISALSYKSAAKSCYLCDCCRTAHSFQGLLPEVIQGLETMFSMLGVLAGCASPQCSRLVLQPCVALNCPVIVPRKQ